MPFVYKTNPDAEFARNKRKAIKQNNGYCLGVPKSAEWRCKCKKFVDQPNNGWCEEALFYKEWVEEEGRHAR